MAMSRLHVKKIREVLRLRLDLGLSYRQIAASVGCGTSVVGECLMRYRASDLNWPLPSDILDTDLELRLYPGHLSASVSKTTPDWLYVHGELKKKSVTKMLLWLEYKAQHLYCRNNQCL